jgi:dihydroceramidase
MFLNQEKNNLGYWSPVTSSVDWCEPNFEHFDSVAETYNTFSSIFYLVMEFWFVYCAERLYRSNQLTRMLRLPRTYLEIFGGLVVGIGTYLFHMTLLREYQMLDELSMNATILVHLYCMINMNDADEKVQDGKNSLRFFGFFNTTKAAITAVICLTLFSISFAVYDTTIPIVFQTLFGLSILAGVGLSVVQAIKKYDNVSSEYKRHFQNARRDKIILLSMVVGSSVLGFAVWLVDNNTCPRFEHYKLHAIWHLFTAYAAYLWGMFALHCHCTDKLAKQLATGEPAAMTKVDWSPLPSVGFVKIIEKSKAQ